MVRVLVFRSWLYALVLLSLSQAKEIWRVGYFDLPPHIFTHNGQVKGTLLPELQAIAHHMNADLHIQAYPLPRMLKLLEESKIDAIALLAYKPERAQKFVYPRIPLFVTHPSILLSKTTQISSYQALGALDVKRIGVWQSGYWDSTLLKSRHTLQAMTGDQFLERALMMADLGRLDGVYSPDEWGLIWGARTYLKTPENWLVVRDEEHPLSLYTVFSKNGAPKWMPRYLKSIQDLKIRQRYVQRLKDSLGGAL